MKKKFIVSLVGTAAAAATYLKVLRPRMINWGATEKEIYRSMPGDAFVENPTYVTTRAITIDASPDEIWPWLVQMGEQRGGFYSYDLIDRLLGIKVHSAHRVLPRFQNLEVGDPLDRKGNMVVRYIEPKHALVIGPAEDLRGQDIDATWTLALYPRDHFRTRLVSRTTAWFNPRSPKALFWLLLLDPGQFIMEQKFLREVKIHAEGRAEKWPPEPGITIH